MAQFAMKTKVGNLEVSTVDTWDHGLETMIFNDATRESDVREDMKRRHRNYVEARDWHDKCVKRLKKEMNAATLSETEIDELANSLRHGGHLNFTNLSNKREVARRCKQLGIQTYSHTAHGSLLDPRYTVEGSHLPDRGLANDYKHYHAKLYCLEAGRSW